MKAFNNQYNLLAISFTQCRAFFHNPYSKLATKDGIFTMAQNFKAERRMISDSLSSVFLRDNPIAIHKDAIYSIESELRE